MKPWILPAAGATVVAGLLTLGIAAAVHDGPRNAGAQDPGTTVPGTTVAPTSSGPRTVTVDGLGTVSGTPDTATVWLGVQVEGVSAADALGTANAKAQKLVDTLLAAGVGKPDIQTGSISVYPRSVDGGTTVQGYTASNSVTAVIHDVGRAGTVIDDVTAAVGDGITLSGVSFSIDDTSSLFAQARKMAVDDARARAGQLAAAAGTSVGGVIAMNESVSGPTGRQYYPAAAGAAPKDAASTVVEPGRQDIQLTVQVVFELVG